MSLNLLLQWSLWPASRAAAGSTVRTGYGCTRAFVSSCTSTSCSILMTIVWQMRRKPNLRKLVSLPRRKELRMRWWCIIGETNPPSCEPWSRKTWKEDTKPSMRLRKIAVLRNGKRKKRQVIATNSGWTQWTTDKARRRLNRSREKPSSMFRSLLLVKKEGWCSAEKAAKGNFWWIAFCLMR